MMRCCIINLKLEQRCFTYHREISTKDADGMANWKDPDQAASLGAVLFGPSETYLSGNIEK